MIPTNLEAAAVETKFAIQQALEKLDAKCYENGFDFDFEYDSSNAVFGDGSRTPSRFTVKITVKKEF